MVVDPPKITHPSNRSGRVENGEQLYNFRGGTPISVHKDRVSAKCCAAKAKFPRTNATSPSPRTVNALKIKIQVALYITTFNRGVEMRLGLVVLPCGELNL
jgi:hypothetical protein